jgi:hypothetical protein
MKKLITSLKNLFFLWRLKESLIIEYVTIDLEIRQRFKVSEFFHFSQLDFKKHLHNLRKNQQVTEISIIYKVDYFSKELNPFVR